MKSILAGAGLMIAVAESSPAATVVSLVGDEDCFGTNKAVCSTVSVSEIRSQPKFPEDGDTDRFGLTLFTFDHVFDLPAGEIVSVRLEFATFDMEDAGAGDGLGGGPFDDLLFIDGTEIAAAFDEVYSPDGTAATQLPVNLSTFALSAPLIPAVADGRVSVVIDPIGGSRWDLLAVDYARLTIEVAPIPSPASLVLLVSGVGALGLCRRRRAA